MPRHMMDKRENTLARRDTATRKKAEKQFRKNQIIFAAQRMFIEKGYEYASIRGIAREAGLSTGAIYAYFKGKDELFGHVYGNIYLTMLDHLEAARSQLAGSIEDKLAGISKAYLAFDRIHPNESDLLSKSLAELDLPDDLRKKLEDLTSKAMRCFADIIEAGITEGFFPPGLNVKESAFVLYSSIEGLLFTLGYAQFPHLGLTADRLVDQTIHYLVEGMRGVR